MQLKAGSNKLFKAEVRSRPSRLSHPNRSPPPARGRSNSRLRPSARFQGANASISREVRPTTGIWYTIKVIRLDRVTRRVQNKAALRFMNPPRLAPPPACCRCRCEGVQPGEGRGFRGGGGPKALRLLELLDPLPATLRPVEGNPPAERGMGAVSPPVRAGALRTPARGGNGRRAGAPGPNGVRWKALLPQPLSDGR
jgi:hypothetical protein